MKTERMEKREKYFETENSLKKPENKGKKSREKYNYEGKKYDKCAFYMFGIVQWIIFLCLTDSYCRKYYSTKCKKYRYCKISNHNNGR